MTYNVFGGTLNLTQSNQSSCKMSPFCGWYSLCLPMKGWPGWVDLGGWLHAKVNVRYRELNPDTITHPSTDVSVNVNFYSA